MAFKLTATLDRRGLRALSQEALSGAIASATRRATTTSLRDMRSEANKRVRAKKRLKARTVKTAIIPQKNKARTVDEMEWGVRLKGDVVRVSDYPHRQTKKGVTASINRGKPSRIKSGFIAPLKSGHRGVFKRKSSSRLPIVEQLASRPVDALLQGKEAEGIATRGANSFAATLGRLLEK